MLFHNTNLNKFKMIETNHKRIKVEDYNRKVFGDSPNIILGN